jgi:predicted nucleotidyltransferase component of viral defense system
MKRYNEQHIRKAEIAQLILLYHLYAQTGSHDLVFQGGTALRWCYGGSRFSEDLDFVTSMPMAALDTLLAKALKVAEREMVPHFGTGHLVVSDKTTREGSKKLLITWQPAAIREKISIKLECEPLVSGTRLATGKLVMSALPSVS